MGSLQSQSNMSFAEVATSDMTSIYVDMYRERQENEGGVGDEQEYRDNLHARVGGRHGAMEKPRALSFTRTFLCRVTCCQSWTRYYVYLSTKPAEQGDCRPP